MSVIRRGETLYIRRKVPKRYEEIESRKFILQSLHTQDRGAAEAKHDGVWKSLIEMWEARLRGDNRDAQKYYDAAVNMANVKGMSYRLMLDVEKLNTPELLHRIEAISDHGGKPLKIEADAFLGNVPKPKIKITAALEIFWDLTRDKTIGMDANQIRKWKNPRKKVIGNFIHVNGNISISDITRDHMLDFRQWLLERITDGGIIAGTANKDLIHLGQILKTVNSLKRLELDLPLGELSFNEGEKNTRPPFSDKWIVDKIMAHGALDGLNTEAKILILGMINTGYRPSEGAMLSSRTIRLDADIPHISIEPGDRKLKTLHSRRTIPLTGVSLNAFQSLPSGFEHYKNAVPSNTINKFLTENGLRETPAHSMYSFRHSFEDRMLSNGVDERIRRDLFGHKLNRERYGSGASLKQSFEILKGFAL